MPVNVASPPPSNLQQTVIEEEKEDPDLSNPVQATKDTLIADVLPEDQPASSSPVHAPAEEEVQVMGSQFVKPPDSSSVLAKIVPDVKPADKSKVSMSGTESLENLDFSALLQEFTQTRRQEDSIIDIPKKKYEVNLLVCP